MMSDMPPRKGKKMFDPAGNTPEEAPSEPSLDISGLDRDGLVALQDEINMRLAELDEEEGAAGADEEAI